MAMNAHWVTSLSMLCCDRNRQKHKASQTDVPMHFRVADAAHICSHGCAQDDSRKTHPGTGAGDSAAMSSRGAAANVPAATSRQPDGPGGQADSSDWQPQPPDKFDFVIDTFGLCSHAAPVEVLKVSAQPHAACSANVCHSAKLCQPYVARNCAAIQGGKFAPPQYE